MIVYRENWRGHLIEIDKYRPKPNCYHHLWIDRKFTSEAHSHLIMSIVIEKGRRIIERIEIMKNE